MKVKIYIAEGRKGNLHENEGRRVVVYGGKSSSYKARRLLIMSKIDKLKHGTNILEELKVVPPNILCQLDFRKTIILALSHHV